MGMYKSWGFQPNPQQKVEFDLGSAINSEEAIWWITLLPPDKRWDIATEYSQKSYMSHWSVQLSDTVRINLTEHSSLENLEPPSSDIAL